MSAVDSFETLSTPSPSMPDVVPIDWESSYNAYYAIAFDIASRKMGQSFHDSEDAAQDTMLNLLRRGGIPSPNDSSAVYRPEGYVTVSAKNTVLDRLRKHKFVQADPELVDPATMPNTHAIYDPEVRVVDTVMDPEVATSLANLGPSHREILMLSAEGQSYEQISEVLGIPMGTVRSRLSRARNMLRTMLDNRGEL